MRRLRCEFEVGTADEVRQAGLSRGRGRRPHDRRDQRRATSSSRSSIAARTWPRRCAPGSLSGTFVPAGAARVVYGKHDRVIRCPWHGWEFDLETGRSLLEPERVRPEDLSGHRRGRRASSCTPEPRQRARLRLRGRRGLGPRPPDPMPCPRRPCDRGHLAGRGPSRRIGRRLHPADPRDAADRGSPVGRRGRPRGRGAHLPRRRARRVRLAGLVSRRSAPRGGRLVEPGRGRCRARGLAAGAHGVGDV